jgi:hypothetical protein
MHAMTVTARSTVTLQRSVEVGRLMTLHENTAHFGVSFCVYLSRACLGKQIVGFYGKI